ITVARNRYIQSVQAYNTFLRSFPQNMTAKMFGYAVKPNFTVANEAAIAAPPTVDFSHPAQPAGNAPSAYLPPPLPPGPPPRPFNPDAQRPAPAQSASKPNGG
ncbi:MAG TPA: LemA family protein, partial [Xanthomonadaceae bacterium]|nr:LemA family protein [Xanthomonadaceae bacterium]